MENNKVFCPVCGYEAKPYVCVSLGSSSVVNSIRDKTNMKLYECTHCKYGFVKRNDNGQVH